MSLRHYLFDVGPNKPDEPIATGSYSTAPLNSVFPPLFTPQLIVYDATLSNLKLQGLEAYIEEARSTRNLDVDAAAPEMVLKAFGALDYVTESLGARQNGTTSERDHSLNVEMSALAGYALAAALDPSLPPNKHRLHVGKEQAGPAFEIRRPVEGPVEAIEAKGYGVGKCTLTKLVRTVQNAPNGLTLEDLFLISRSAGQVLIKVSFPLLL